MDTNTEATGISRREFHSALVLVWTFIMLAFSTLVFSSHATVPNIIYLVVAVVMVANYAFKSFGGDSSRRRQTVAVLFAAIAIVIGITAFAVGRF